MLPVGGQARRDLRHRLFDEAGDGVHAGRVGQRVTNLDVAISRFRRGRAHAERHDLPGTRRRGRRGQRDMQRVRVGDGGIRGHHPQHRPGIFLGHQDGGGGDGGGAVAARGFQDDARAGNPGLPQLLGDQEPMLLIAHHDRRRESWAARPQDRVLHQRFVRQQRPELLREAFPRHGPKTGAGPTGQDDGDDLLRAHADNVCLKWGNFATGKFGSAVTVRLRYRTAGQGRGIPPL